jgi:hypothetical protein
MPVTVIYGGHTIEIDAAGMTIEQVHAEVKRVLNLPDLDDGVECVISNPEDDDDSDP